MGREELPDEITDPPLYYDPDGNPIGLRTWARLREDWALRRVAADVVGLPGGGEAFVSTVWLGMNHNLGFGPPMIYETMIFWKPGDYGSEDYCQWYTTRAQALAGHDQAVEHARNLGQVPQRARDE